MLGHGTQTALGAALILLAIGLVFRSQTCWAFALLIVAISVCVNLWQRQFGFGLAIPGLLLVALIVFRRQFQHRTNLANYLLSAISIAAVIAYGVVGALLLGRGFRPPIDDSLTALYYTVVTLSTVGYGDIVPVTHETRLFVISLLIFGLGIFATAIASTIGPAIAGQLGRFFQNDEDQMPLKDHVILVGSGAVAENTARQLEDRSLDYMRIFEQTPHGDGAAGRSVVGDPADESVLREAGITDARMVIAAGDDDSENAFVSLLAKDLNPSVRVFAVASSERSIRRLQLARADVVFAPSVIGGRLIADLVEGGTIPSEFADLLQQTETA